MSDKSVLEQLSDIKGLLTTIVAAAVACMAIGAALMEWRIDVNVREAMSNTDLATDANIVGIKSDVADNRRTGLENAEDIEQNRERVESAFEVLLGRPTND